MSQSSKPAGNEWFDQFARTSLIYRIMEKARAGELPEDRTRAILSLGERGDPRAVVTLMECCSDTDPVIRMNAIDALTRLKSGRAVPTLIRRLEDPGESLENRCRAAKALAEINTHTSAEGLMTLVNDEEEEPALREYIAVLMEKQGLG